ncbi:MAG: NAD(P)/FAD-dependent oxidoreductase [Candidatus Doudnabacteria bacterium]|nr:NAD(P)/FAD-dependent oxidoreductase [Candidatus Doudnabacteria bacterium]
MHDVLIIGAGPAGLAAALFATQKKLKTLVIAKDFSDGIKLDVADLTDYAKLKKIFKTELKNKPETLEFISGEEVLSLEKNVISFSAETKTGRIFYGKSIIICSGSEQNGKNGNTVFDLLTLKNSSGFVKVDGKMAANVPGIFAAGQVTDANCYDEFVSMGEGARAALSAWFWIKKR